MEDNVVARMVQVGIVTAVSPGEHKCRVKFPDTGLTSDWLMVLRQAAAWMPRVNDTVLVLYIPVFNSDGFVIGVVQ